MNELSELSFIETPLMDRIGFLQLLLRFYSICWWFPLSFVVFTIPKVSDVIITSLLH